MRVNSKPEFPIIKATMTDHEPVGILTRAYFRMKPFIPERMRWAIRRNQAGRVLKRTSHCWPIDERSAARPPDWRGWPNGKRFGFVITHDVESARGVEQVRPLAAMERRLGFKSSFNFIPEGTYEDPVCLRAWLTELEFEIGVHDLHHDGHLFASRRQFSRSAEKINHYLDKWGASGFRSGFMLRELDWIHELDVLYDASTFDTDPFEPQPCGVGTIFPFEVKSEDDHIGSYVELPYTLPQDSTLFLLLREVTPEVWMRKLDWIASHGGLALVNIHPDYIRFSQDGYSGCSYPVAIVEQFLEYVKDKYENQFWNPLPRELAGWVQGTMKARFRANGAACR